MSETALITPPLQTLIDNLDRAAESPSRRALFAQMTAAALGVMFAGGAARRAFAGPRPVGDIIVVSLENHTVTVYPIEGEDPRIGLDVAPIDDPDNPIYSSTHSGTLTDPMILQIEALADLANDLHPGHVHRFNAMLASFGLSELAVPTAIGGGPPSGGETEGGAGYAGGFVLILVLFILLVIIGAGFGLGYGGYSDE